MLKYITYRPVFYCFWAVIDLISYPKWELQMVETGIDFPAVRAYQNRLFSLDFLWNRKRLPFQRLQDFPDKNDLAYMI